MESFPSKICWNNKKERKSILEFDKSKHGFFTGLIIFRFEQTLGNDHINVGTAIPKEIKYETRENDNDSAEIRKRERQGITTKFSHTNPLGLQKEIKRNEIKFIYSCKKVF